MKLVIAAQTDWQDCKEHLVQPYQSAEKGKTQSGNGFT
jgi:hypothetical protein